MKIRDIILIAAVLLLVVIGVISSKGTAAQEEIEFPLTLAGKVGLNEVTYSEYEKMVNKI